MNIAVIGASGMVGRRIVRELLDRGHSVRGLVRDPSHVEDSSERLTVGVADALDPAGIAQAVAGHDAVASAYSPPHTDTSVLVAATRSLIAGLSNAGVHRFVMVGGAGGLEVAPGVRLIDTAEFPEAWRSIAQAHIDALDVLRLEGGALEWTSISPAALIEPGTRTGVFRTDDDRLIVDAQGESRISAEDFAIAVVDELETPAHIQLRFTVGY